jgi:malonate-semialdehyde dehydrogenase (acetylating)/methylmalonate-semialdehyde dehydrogenase
MEVVEHGCSMASLSMGSTLLNAARGIDTISYNLPLGVCAGVAPFNFPAMIPLWMIPLSITLGNTFVLKPSERVRVLYSRFQARVYYWLSICKKLDFLKVCSTL